MRMFVFRATETYSCEFGEREGGERCEEEMSNEDVYKGPRRKGIWL